MDRTIEVKVNGSYITKDNRNAGVQHEANSTSLRIEFDPGWDSYAKKITWWNAKGEDPVEITLGTNLLEDAAASTRIYLCPIPGEPLAECGECTFVIDGYTDGKRQRSAADRLWVKEAPFKETAGQPGDPTPSQAEQLQKEIDGIKGTISQAVASRDAAAESAALAKASETAADSSAGAAAKSEAAAAGSASSAAADASAAAKSAGAAAQSEQNAKASETAAKSSETTASSAAATAAQAKTAAESAQAKADKAQAAADSAKEAAEAAQGKAESAQTAAESAKTAAESSGTAAAASEKSAQSWAVGGTGTRVGEDTNNAKYWSERASAIVGGDFATKEEAQGYVATHNQSSAAHADLRQAIESKENAGAAAAVQQRLEAHTGNATIHITAAERTKWNAKEEGGAADAVQQNLTAHMGDTVKHVTAAERTKWNGKADLVNGKVPSSQLPAADAFTKAETLKAATAALFGLGTSAVPDDILSAIGKYKQYWWRRRLPAELNKVPKYTNISTTVQLIPVSTYNPGNKVIQVSSVVDVNQSTGAVSLLNPENFTIISTADTTVGLQNCQALVAKAPCYIFGVMNQTGNVYYLPAGSTAGVNQGYKEDDSWTNDPSTTTVTMHGRPGKFSQILDNPTKASGAPYAQLVTYEEKTVPASDWQYIQSSNRNAYPDSGTQAGYEYEYLGIPFDNAVTAPKIETGSYVGTGNYGTSNLNTLTFASQPKLVIIFGGYTIFALNPAQRAPTFSSDGNDRYYTCHLTWSGNQLSWFSYANEKYQCNTAGETYHYIAIG